MSQPISLWADKKNLLSVYCFVTQKYGGLVLASIDRNLSNKTKRSVLQVVASLGFNPEKLVVLPQETNFKRSYDTLPI